MEQEKCPHCGTTDRPTAKLRDGERYFFCERCKKTITYDDLDKAVEEDVRINYYYDGSKEYVMIKIPDWEILLKMLEEGGAELHRSEDE